MRRWIFWEFARASWQYDLVVALLLAFVLRHGMAKILEDLLQEGH